MPYVYLKPESHATFVQRRLDENWTQHQVALAAGVALSTLQNLEKGNTERFQEEIVVRICGVLSVSIHTVVRDGAMARSSVETEPAIGIVPLSKHSTEPVALFLAAPMASVGQAYTRYNRGIVKLARDIEEGLNLKPVYYAGRELDRPSQFEDESIALRANLDALNRARRFMLIYPRPLPTSALIELGIAMARGIPARIFVREWRDLPYMLRSVTRVQPQIAVLRYRSLADVLGLLGEESGF